MKYFIADIFSINCCFYSYLNPFLKPSELDFLYIVLSGGGVELRYLKSGPGRIGISGGFLSGNGIMILESNLKFKN